MQKHQSGFVDIRNGGDQKHFPKRLDALGQSQSALFKIKPMNSEWRMPVYPHEEVISSKDKKYTLCVTGEALRIKH